MLELDETLFVEHKSDLLVDSSYNVARPYGVFRPASAVEGAGSPTTVVG